MNEQTNKWSQKRLYYEVVLPFSDILQEIELEGFKIDKERLDEVDFEFTSKISSLKKQISQYTGNINIGSSKQLAKVLYEDLKIPNYIEDFELKKDGKKLKWEVSKDEFLTSKEEEWNWKHPEEKVEGTSTDVNALKKIRHVYKHPVADLLLEFRKYAKLKSTYIDGLRDLIHIDGKVHPVYYQMTVGSRPKCQSPNLLQVPSRSEEGKKIKSFFVVDDGYDLISADFSAMELRFLAWMSNDRVMWPAFLNNLDVHSITCSNIKEFGLSYEESCLKENKTKRFCAKTTNFLIVYGGSYATLQNALLKQGDLYIDKRMCASFIDTFFKTYPDVRPLQNSVFDYVDRNYYITNLFGRKRYFPELKNIPKDKTEERQFRKIKGEAHRSAFSHYVSSSSSGEYSAYKCVLLKKEIKRRRLDVKFVNALYDGFYYKCNKNDTKEFVGMMEELMSKPDNPVSISLPMEIEIGSKWSEV